MTIINKDSQKSSYCPLDDPAITEITNTNNDQFAEDTTKLTVDFNKPKDFSKNLSKKEEIAIQLEKRQDDLNRREKIVREREETLIKKESIYNSMEIHQPKNNWPFTFYPLDKHNIETDIPFPSQRLCKRAYHTWILTCISLFLNIGSMITVMSLTFGVVSSPMENLLWSIIYLCVGVVLSWIGWYKSLYNALRNIGKLSWTIFWVSFALHILFVIYSIVGMPNWATSGIFNLLAQLGAGGSWAVVSLCVVSITLWSINLLLSLIICRSAFVLFKSRGEDEKLRREVKSTIVAEITNTI